jgi:hypothetical protein
MRKLTIFSLLVLVSLAASGGAQDKNSSPAGNGISAAVILEKNLTATGGREAHERVQSMVVHGELGLSSPRSGEFSYFYQAPSSRVLQLRINGIGTMWAGDHEGKAISRTVPEGLDLMRMDNIEIEPLNVWAVLIDLNNLLKRHLPDDIKVELLGGLK